MSNGWKSRFDCETKLDWLRHNLAIAKMNLMEWKNKVIQVEAEMKIAQDEFCKETKAALDRKIESEKKHGNT